MSDVDDLKAAVAAGHAIVILGAGFAVGTSGGHPAASWIGLIESGIEFVIQHDVDPSRWVGIVRDQVQMARDEDDGEQLLQAASQVATRIRGMGEQSFSNWLEASVGALTVVDAALGEAVSALAAPVFTTNYDTLFEEIAGRPSTDWEDARGFQAILSGGGSVGHLHGVHTNPSSVILSAADYQRLILSEPAQHLQQAMSSTRVLVYIGCGGTLEDPNFAALLGWHRNTFAPSGVRHYRLCIEGDLSDARVTHRDDNIQPISFGSKFSDLAPFVAALAPDAVVARTNAGIVRDTVGEAREYLVDQVRSETILGEGLSDLDDRSLDDLTIEPVLLPLPHAEYFKSRGKGDRKPERVDVETDVDTDGVVLVVGDDNSGLSTALRWLIYRASERRLRAAPLLVDFRRFQPGLNPLSAQVRLEAFHRGLISKKKSDLPPLVVAVDNFHAHTKTSVRAVEDLATQDGLTILGCHSAFESESIELLRAQGIEPRVRYLGKLGVAEVTAMARLASTARADVLASTVISTLRSEHLPRTPFTVALLVSIMMRGESLVANASPTTILEQYVSHLLGRDESDQDSRLVMTATDRESILTDLARMFVNEDRGSMLQSEVIERMEGFFTRFAWKESPARVLEDLVRRRVLAYDGPQVKFTQSSFLHLFAAKAAVKDRAILNAMVSRPLYYSPVIRAYAALVRHDADLLRSLGHLTHAASELEAETIAFAKLEIRAAPDDLVHQMEVLPTDDEQEENVSHVQPDDPFDASEDTDVLPFPLTTDAELPPVARAMQGVSLLSFVLRDSEEVDDLDLKQETLAKVLLAWGQLVDALIEDQSFQDMTESLKEQAAEAGLNGDVDEFLKVLPAIVVWAAISLSLASRKLLVLLSNLIDAGALVTDARAACTAALLAYSIHDPDWEEHFTKLVESHLDSWFVNEVLVLPLFMEFDASEPGSEAEHRIRALLVRTYLAGFTFKNDAHKKEVAGGYGQRLDRIKAQSRARKSVED